MLCRMSGLFAGNDGDTQPRARGVHRAPDLYTSLFLIVHKHYSSETLQPTSLTQACRPAPRNLTIMPQVLVCSNEAKGLEEVRGFSVVARPTSQCLWLCSTLLLGLARNPCKVDALHFSTSAPAITCVQLLGFAGVKSA